MSFLRTRAIAAWLQAFVGFLAAGTLSVLFCKLPPLRSLTPIALLFTATKYVLIALLAGVAGIWLFRISFSKALQLQGKGLVRYAAAGWLLVPGILLFFRQNSLWMVALATICGAVSAISLRAALPADLPVGFAPQAALFSEPLRSERRPWLAIALSLGIFFAFFAMQRGLLWSASFLSGTCIAVFLWQLTSTYKEDAPQKKDSAPRLAALTLFAILVTAFALLPRLRQQHFAGSNINEAPSHARTSASMAQQKDDPFGYRGIILWTEPPRKKELTPIPRPSFLQAGSKANPLIIPFHGAYWYFQQPYAGPGTKAHVAYGSPIAVTIHATDWLPLLMEAHQHLDTSMEIACCREMEVTIQNGDNHPGTINLGVVLTDTTSAGKPSQNLGTQPVVSSLSDHFSIKPSPIVETLRFPIPAQAAISRFNEITVIFMPTYERSKIGAKIAVQQFEFTPR